MLFDAALTIHISCIGLFGLSVLSAEKRKRNRHPQSIGRICQQHCVHSFNRFFKVNFYFIDYINAVCMDGNKQVVAELSLSDHA